MSSFDFGKLAILSFIILWVHLVDVNGRGSSQDFDYLNQLIKLTISQKWGMSIDHLYQDTPH